MWTDYYLQFETEAAMLAALPEDWQTEEGVVMGQNWYALDLIGTLFDEWGEPLAGYHANLRLTEGYPLPAVLAPYLLQPPATPQRVWA